MRSYSTVPATLRGIFSADQIAAFTANPVVAPYTTNITTSNLTESPILITVKTNNKNDYKVIPNIFKVEPFESQEIKIEASKIPKISNKKQLFNSDKFQFGGYILKEEDVNTSA